ncbi:glutaminase domain-containing protein [Parabacteroides sp. Marseille-P3160]|uniref:glutaminase domain-containing protein n=1 Tax=Parabacteroides sp. Marseille-P3160 TaxID=1917887 RepID=UPI0009B9F483
MRKIAVFLLLLSFFLSSCVQVKETKTYTPAANNALRAPAYPLVTIDPYASAWSFADKLNEDAVRHWTGKEHPLIGAVRVDGKSYRFLGKVQPPLQTILPTAQSNKWEAAYTEKQPSGDWKAPAYSDADWKKGTGAFGTKDQPNLATPWESKDIWVRRSFELADDLNAKKIILEYSHDDIFELYINGIKVVATDYTWKNNVLTDLSDEVKATLKKGKNVIAAHCHNKTGGGYVDFGLFTLPEEADPFETAATQTAVVAMPTQTYYTFECGGIQLDVIFTAPFLMDDLYAMTSPYNYITYQARSIDGKSHEVQVYLEATPQWAVNSESQKVTFEKIDKGGMTFLKTGTEEQAILGKKGDDVRIDWGYFYLGGKESAQTKMKLGDYYTIKKEFASTGSFSGESGELSSNMRERMSVLAYTDDLGKVSSKNSQGYFLIGYDDLYSIQYFGENLLPYWKRGGKVDIYTAFADGYQSYADIMERCDSVDAKLMKEGVEAGGQKYAELCALAYRQSIAAHKLVTDKEGNLLFLSKENFSNGSIGTVDITYPSAPLFLIYNPELLKGMMNPIFYFSESGKWTKPFAAHDVGTYPLANGQTYGGDMPVEECGNMLILTAAIAAVEGNADYAAKHWTVLTTWADYLMKEGLDPANQLCTDDFAGHFAHNANLSVKAIEGIAGYGKLAEILGKKDIATKYLDAAREMASQWIKMADDGDHYRLTFDKAGTWSQKYNLIWDQLLGLNIFPKEVAEKELAYYLTKQNTYGLPLDNREDYSKSDWILWSACLTGSPEHFDALMQPVWKYADETPSRVPMSDWYFTSTAKQRGFQARSVVGGYFMRLLQHRLENKK